MGEETTAPAAPTLEVTAPVTDPGITGGINTAPTAPPPTKPSFLDSAPDEYKEAGWVKEFAKAQDPFAAMFKSYEHAQKKISEKPATGIEIPAADAPEDAWKAFHKAIGVPDSADAYEYKAPDITAQPEKLRPYLTEAMSSDDATVKEMKAAAHAAGVTPKAFEALATKWSELRIKEIGELVEASEANVAKAHADREAKLKGLYGDNAEKIRSVAKETMGKALSKEALATEDPEVMLIDALKFIQEKMYSNDTVGAQGQGAPATSLAELEAKIAEHRAKKDPMSGKAIIDDDMSSLRDGWKKELDDLYIRKRQMELSGGR